MKDWITGFMEEYGYLGVMLMLAVENIFPPIPSEVILPFGGFMTTNSELTLPGVVIAATVGSLLGAVILYAIGRQLDVERMEALVDKYGRYLKISRKDVRKADAWFDRYGGWTVLFCRMIPLVRSLISIPAGMSGMNFGLFLFYTTIGTLGWNILLVSAGAALGASWESITGYMDLYSNAVYALLLVGAGTLGYLFWRKRRKPKPDLE
ncbi:DedA family protein [Gorillibacterium timonense]|uniref:DedA family protein n=1 Tax=Gorillibacterium timonense TaxID=1689269 RepID=UPI00071C255D|nr:DedA family protein [Gorillibacterium timonense]